MTDLNPLERAFLAAVEPTGPTAIYEVGPGAVIQLADGSGHLVTDATITHWTRD